MAYLRLYLGDSLLQQWKIESDRVTIGRSRKNDIVLGAPGVSKHHAIITRQGHNVEIVDLDSANGVFVNGTRIRRQVLKYWDEIQIVNFVVKFMAAARLPGEQLGTDLASLEQSPEATREFDITSVGDLARLRKDSRVPHLAGRNGTKMGPVTVDTVNFSIGSGKKCDMRIKGWFVPKTVAYIQRRTNGFFLLRNSRGKIAVNERKIHREVELRDDDEVIINRQHFKFYFRPIARN